MELIPDNQSNTDAAEDLQRLLEIGQLLASVLTESEKVSLRLLMEENSSNPIEIFKVETGNTSVT
jgi:hypothetical protein